MFYSKKDKKQQGYMYLYLTEYAHIFYKNA